METSGAVRRSSKKLQLALKPGSFNLNLLNQVDLTQVEVVEN
jgi:hypothetical protein